MKIGIGLLVTIVVGLAAGSALGWRRAADPGPAYEQFVAGKLALYFPPDPNAGQGTPRLETPEGTVHDFGVMGAGETRSHQFLIRNTGTAALTLVVRDTTCRCTLGELQDSSVPPGGSTYVTLEWTSKDYTASYKQMALLTTNDPDQDELYLTVQGTVLPLARLEPKELNFTNVPVDAERTTHAILFGYDRDDLQVVDHEWLDDATAQYFELEVVPDDNALAREPNAKVALQCRITVKPGLPLGSFYQRVRLKLNEPRLPELELSVGGTVTSDITVSGRGFDKSRNLLMLESLAQNSDTEQLLTIFIKGEGHKEVELSVAEVDPADVLQVELDEPKHLDPVSVYTLRVRIPAGGPLVNRLGSPDHPWGRIELATTRSETPRVTIYVRFAVVP